MEHVTIVKKRLGGGGYVSSAAIRAARETIFIQGEGQLVHEPGTQPPVWRVVNNAEKDRFDPEGLAKRARKVRKLEI